MKYLFFNGKILTQNKNYPIAEVVLVNKNKIEYVGNYKELSNIGDYKKIDLKGKLLLPGFIDTHIHFYEYIKRKNHIDLSNLVTLKELKTVLKNIDTKDKGSIKCFGLNISLFDKKTLNRYFLDSIIENIPLIIMSSDYHTLLSNSKMITIVEEFYSRNQKGEQKVTSIQNNGYFYEDYRVVLNNFPEEESFKNIESTIEEFQKLGITTIEEMAFSSKDFNFYDKVSLNNKIRVVRNFPEELLDDMIDKKLKFLRNNNKISGKNLYFEDFTINDDKSMFKLFGGLKLFYDGSLGSKTALLSKNYQDDIEYKGIRIRDKNNFHKIVDKAIKNNISVITHAIGDKAIKEVVDIYCMIDKKYISKDKRRDYILRIEHVQHIDDETIKKIKDNNIYVTMQPTHLGRDIEIIDKIGWIKILSYRFNSFKKAGVIVGFSSDAPIETINPFLSIYSAITHSDYRVDKILNPQEAISIEEAIKSYSIDAAKLNDNQKNIGSIAVS
jgi:predicted amidohydrolase YtcJ